MDAFLRRAQGIGLTLAVAAPYAVGLLLSGQPVTSQAVGLMTLAALMTYRMAAYRRGRFPVLGDPLEVAATVILAWAIGDFARPLPILFLGLTFRSFYGSTRSTARATIACTASWSSRQSSHRGRQPGVGSTTEALVG
jgi:hypothetical protein